MKKTLSTLMLLIGITLTALAQNVIQPDSVYSYYHNPGWNRQNLFTYDNNGLLTEHHALGGSENYGEGKNDHYQYDVHANCTSAIMRTWWSDAIREQVIDFGYQDSLLVNEHELCVITIAEGWGGGTDTTYRNTIYSYDEEARPVEILTTTYNRITKTSFEYTENSVGETFEVFHAPTQEWMTMSNATKVYSKDGQILSCQRTLLNNNIWSTRLTVYHYNEQGKPTGYTTQLLEDNEYVNENRAKIELNNDGMPAVVRFEDWIGENWVQGSSKLYEGRILKAGISYRFSFNEFILFNEDYLKRQEDLLFEDGIEHMELFYTNTPYPTYNVCEKPETNGITVHPNPTKGQFSVSGTGMTKVEVYNLLGERLIERHCSDETTIDLGKQLSGMYLITITDDQGKQHTQKVVKE